MIVHLSLTPQFFTSKLFDFFFFFSSHGMAFLKNTTVEAIISDRLIQGIYYLRHYIFMWYIGIMYVLSHHFLPRACEDSHYVIPFLLYVLLFIACLDLFRNYTHFIEKWQNVGLTI